MAYLKPDKTKVWNGVTVKEFFLHNHNDFGLVLPTAKRKKTVKVTIHNTDWIKVNPLTTPAEQYTRATYYNNMRGVVVHFYVDHTCAWQNLDLAYSSFHSGDGMGDDSGNMTSISIEVIMDATKNTYNQKAMENAAKLAAYLLKMYNLNVVNGLVTHTYWLNKMKGITGSKNDICTIPPSPEVDSKTGKMIYYKICPYYIINGKGWNYFESIVKDSKFSTAMKELFYVRKSWKEAETQLGAFSNLDNAKALAEFNYGYKVFNSKGRGCYTPRQYFEKYTVMKKAPVKNAPKTKEKTIDWLDIGVSVAVYRGVTKIAENGTVWTKIRYGASSKHAWIPLSYIMKP